MELNILNARMTHSKEEGYIGKVEFAVTGHREPYEITLHSKNGKEWSYGLFFLKESGDENEIVAVEDLLEEDDEAYYKLIDAAKAALQQS